MGLFPVQLGHSDKKDKRVVYDLMNHLVWIPKYSKYILDYRSTAQVHFGLSLEDTEEYICS